MHYVIIGNGIAGISAAQCIREREVEAKISIVGDESAYLYSRTALMWAYMGRMTRRNLEPYERWFWQENKFELIFDRAVELDTTNQTLLLSKGDSLKYDKLLLATGSEPNFFGWPGQDLDGVVTFTNLHDLDAVEAKRGKIKKAVVVGGGLIGIELVEILLHDGVEVTYLIREPWYFQLALSETEAKVVHKRITNHGARLILEDEIQEIRGQHGTVHSLLTKQGETLPCDLVGIAVGVHPRLELAKQAGISCGRGIIVNQYLQTAQRNIWACGDCAEIKIDPAQERGQIEALWYTSNRQGIVAGKNMVGDEIPYDRGIPYNSAQFLFLDYVTTGWMTQFRPELKEYQWINAETEHVIRISYNDENIVQGFSLLGPRYCAAKTMQWIREKRSLDYVRKRMPEAAYNEEFTRVTWKGVQP